MGGALIWGSEHTTQWTENVLCNCGPEACTILPTSVTPIHPIKWGKINELLTK